MTWGKGGGGRAGASYLALCDLKFLFASITLLHVGL